MKTVLHLTSSRFLGGPERQMLGLAEHLDAWRSVFASFSEEGHCRSFLNEAKERGFQSRALTSDTPRLLAATAELRRMLREISVDVLVCHGYKADLIGRLAASAARIPAIGVSRGWTGESMKVRRYEWLDRRVLRWLDAVVCVSQAQADKVRRAGVPSERIVVIRNSVVTGRFLHREPAHRTVLNEMFECPPRLIVGAAGRLSPEKGFDVLIRAAAKVVARNHEVGFLVFGEGPLRDELQGQIVAAGLQKHVKLVGFRADLDRYFPHFDVLALPSLTEGLPNVVLEAFAAEVPVVATSVGGVPEIVDNGSSGYLVASGDHAALASGILALADDEGLRRAMGAHGRRRVDEEFSFGGQAQAYETLFRRILMHERIDRPVLETANSSSVVVDAHV